MNNLNVEISISKSYGIFNGALLVNKHVYTPVRIKINEIKTIILDELNNYE